jgi:hypothetical protein
VSMPCSARVAYESCVNFPGFARQRLHTPSAPRKVALPTDGIAPLNSQRHRVFAEIPASCLVVDGFRGGPVFQQESHLLLTVRDDSVYPLVDGSTSTRRRSGIFLDDEEQSDSSC